MRISDIVRRHRRGMLFAVSLVVIENVAWIVEPSVFGRVIDAMIGAVGKPGSASPLVPLLVWIGVFGINSGVGAIRRSVDQRIYLGMFTEIATGVARSSFDRNLGVSQTTARVQLSREYIQFLQYRVPEIVEQVIAIGGALIGMAFFDMRIASACLIVLAPLVAINSLYSRRVVALHGEVHDSAEEAFEVIAAKDPERVRAYYAAMAVPQQKIANWGAFSFSLMRLVLLGIFLVVLYIAIDLDDFTTGNIYTIVAYIWTFVTSSEYLPDLMESLASLKDMSRRLYVEVGGAQA